MEGKVKTGDVLIGLSLIAVLLSVLGAFDVVIWLASTQWVLIAATLAIYAIYVKVRS